MSQNYFTSVTAEEMEKAFAGDLFRHTLEIMPAGVLVLKSIFDKNGLPADFRVIFSNRAARVYSGENDKAEKISDTVHSQKDFLGMLLHSMKEANTSDFLQHDQHDAQPASLLYHVTPLKDGLLLVHENVSDVGVPPGKSSTLKAEGESQLIHSLAQATPDILFVMNLYTREVVYVNRSVEKMLGYTHAEIEKMSAPFFDMIYADDLPIVLNHLEEMKNAGLNEVREIVYRLRDAKGQLRWFLDRNTIFKVNEEGKGVEKTGILRDISQSKISEEKIHELNRNLTAKNHELASANSEIKTFNEIAANDYKETLQHLYTGLEFILTTDARNLSDAGKGNLRKMQSAIQKMKLLTEDIIAFSKLHTLDNVLANVDLNEILRSAKEDLEEKLNESNADIEAEELPHISGFSLLLNLLFYHLIDNAVKFRQERDRPQIRIKYERSSMQEDDAAAQPGRMYHKISVIDAGKGFEAGSAEKIFGMFYRSDGKRYKGSGVGLAICRKVMDLHNGFISAESNGEGAVFNCFFPDGN